MNTVRRRDECLAAPLRGPGAAGGRMSERYTEERGAIVLDSGARLQWRPQRGASGTPYAALNAIMGEAGLVMARAHPVTGELYLTLATKPAASAATGASR